MTQAMLQYEYNHLVHEVEWFKKRMTQYRQSLYDIKATSDKAESLEELKKFIEKEHNTY